MDETRRLTFADTDRETAQLVRGLLALGLGKVTRIGLLMPNCMDWVLSFLAITRAGATAVPLSTFFQVAELSWGIRHNDLDTLLICARFLTNDYPRASFRTCRRRRPGEKPGMDDFKEATDAFLEKRQGKFRGR